MTELPKNLNIVGVAEVDIVVQVVAEVLEKRGQLVPRLGKLVFVVVLFGLAFEDRAHCLALVLPAEPVNHGAVHLGEERRVEVPHGADSGAQEPGLLDLVVGRLTQRLQGRYHVRTALLERVGRAFRRVRVRHPPRPAQYPAHPRSRAPGP